METFPPRFYASGSPVATRKFAAAFSLIEVVLALGIVAFALLPIVGILPVGLNAVKNTHGESAAANALVQVTAAIRDATTNATGTYKATGGFGDMTWSLGGASATFTTPLAMNGQPAPLPDARLIARVEIVPPSDAMTPGQAFISIAWPPSATWDAAHSKWIYSEGSISSGIQFLSKQ